MNKEGRWVKDLDESFPELRFGYICSECGERQTYGVVRFCMNCGAAMDDSKSYGDAFEVWGEENGND